MRLGAATIGVAFALVVGAVLAEPSHAYRLAGKKWPTRTITYHAATPQYDDAIKAAVAAWNASGARIRFKPASRSRAKLRIVYGANRGGPSGFAVLGFIRPTLVTLKEFGGFPLETNVPCGTRVSLPDGRSGRIRCKRERMSPRVSLDKVSASKASQPYYKLHMALTVAHELGHVLGLDHVTKQCSVMNYAREAVCPAPPQPWQLRCRLLEADDVRGAISRYGGRARPLATEFCDTAPPAAAPTELTATFDGDERAIVVTWRNAGTPTLRAVRLTLTRDSCATEPGENWSQAKPGAADSITLDLRGEPAGRYCASVWSEDEHQRTGLPATTWVDVPPEPEPPPDEPV
jgi:hypothetical protein